MKNKLYVFDIDGCMLNTPEPEGGKLMYEKIFQQEYPHKGWWGRVESLSLSYDIRTNNTVHDLYNQAIDDGSMVMMMTNRLKKLGPLINAHLGRHGIKFEHMSYGDSEVGQQTKPNRLRLFLSRLDIEHIDHIIVLDDADEQISHYINMRSEMDESGSPIRLQILQVTSDGTIVEK